jgi:hypothetical protein
MPLALQIVVFLFVSWVLGLVFSPGSAMDRVLPVVAGVVLTYGMLGRRRKSV